MANSTLNFPVASSQVTVPASQVSITIVDNVGVTLVQTGDTLTINPAVVVVTPPPVTTSVKISPTGSADNSNWTSQFAAAIKAGVPAELKAGTYQLNPFTFGASLNGLQLVMDAGVTIKDASIFAVTDVLLTIAAGFSGSITGNNTVVTMPTNYTNAKAQVAAGKDYEYQHGLVFTGTTGTVTISGLNIAQTGGDGVNFHTVAAGAKITLTNISSITNIRQGWSVTGKCVGSVTLNSCSANNGPMTGFDFEPNLTGDSVTGFVLNNFATSKNAGGGVSFGFMNLGATAVVGVTVNGYTSTTEGQGAVGFWNNNSGVKTNATGTVTMSNYTITNSQYDGVYGRKSTDGWTMVFNNGTIINPNTGGLWAHYGTNAAIGVGLFGGETGTPGGVQWNGVTITGGNGATDISGAKNVIITGTWNGKSINVSQ